ncbi:ABC transporter permease subunit [Ponticoccus sp. SC2-23]|uniref:ABC transporter permease n=1 Tax=Alexandriicola marinus TaxID=2081710 RepID=UPI000FD892D7|nr:ABC transporter permease subunit [Alexandriicola marinus]MBM1221621.1 ABC transporter permease subunit [Ponticoccus sp. SC6-9]MBM1226662.1 ABC transporter permease subunit [Ponticoccus sp. SC6-15]MBM1230613.1 ABC transporter permease subunit [Ponticoccus sp. SC6-38]MBM1235136.1 ABC transporter permease subunit [Ponticoccus sp. SC6-45]MBM1239634.1 ABC transporter permease subunit [Ponticoccus sp. SC6-49]MBM1243416.1 ABC transporter permease subunit [Ponticoccus sp. SC2-64]MBM1248660.1 ABC 
MGRARGDGTRGFLLEAASLPLLFLIWHLLALAVSHRLFPTPVEVIVELWRLATERHLVADLAKTLVRAAWAFVAAMTIGSLIGAVLGRFRGVDRLFGSWVLIGLNIPAIVVAITCYIWLGLSEFALILAVTINKTPLVAVTMREGVRALDYGFAELGRVYRLDLWRRVRLIVIPQLMPYMLTAARTGLSLIWKIVLVFEVLGSDGGVGFRIGVFFQNFDIEGILAYTLAFMTVVITFEYLVMRRLEARILGWRPT